MKWPLHLSIVGLAVVASGAAAQAPAPSGEEIIRRAYLARYYSGEDTQARVTMRLVSKDGAERIRELVMTRLNLGKGGEQRYFLFFTRPPDVRDMAFLVWAHPGRDDDRWLYVPALKMVRRIAASDKHTSFVGSDFSYEDVSGREPEEDTHKLLREESTGEREVYVVEGVPKDPADADFGRKLSWVDKATWLPLKEEYYDRRGDLARVFTAEDLREVQGYWTTMKRVMRNVQSGHWTEVVFGQVRYNRKLSPELFGERSLRAAPAELAK